MLALLSRESEPHFQHHATLLDFFWIFVSQNEDYLAIQFIIHINGKIKKMGVVQN